MTSWRSPAVLPVERVTDFDNDEDRERHRLWMRIVEDLTVEAREHPRLSRTLHVVGLSEQSRATASLIIDYSICVKHDILCALLIINEIAFLGAIHEFTHYHIW